ncbi:hypothetical protein DSLASN_30550 [Desulfoluna limicola]|uniref:site-specific DNA-methyltransferase (adenine-specific) n=1 Tax=Desulfoluna limicola TaxID=2810562 RepID=A0ABN6F9C8_9BACT|nr:BREX-1 system adenine-specific DNA-methyltransferase PglX [Desulfoluna limicola]BCS97423.1 hypothetical protein DSLASN_30550 [Desulfoluna limicola]
MDTGSLKKFAQEARRTLQQEVSAKLDWVLKTDSAELRESAKAIEGLKKELEATSREAVIEKAAYIWFNRFCALRFMDLKGYTRMGIVSPAPEQTQPEILAEAKMGHIDDRVGVSEERVRDLLSGRIPSRDAEGEAYRLLLVAVCNDWNPKLPFLFERIADWTELLMPEDLLSEKSLLHCMRGVLTEETCEDVEVIGWLYQFYISEKKDEVFEALKKNKKIEAENIPAATQLFTPNWIVRYLVENSLGRLWMQNNPASKLVERMDYYIPDKPNESDSNDDAPSFLKVSSPEEIKICDPACGSGHMLVYAFELLAAIYEEEGYAPKEIPGLILEKNLVGIEIDPRAGSLAAFALVMKACDTHRRFIRKPVRPNICVLKSIHFTENELDSYMKAAGNDLMTHNLRLTLEQFADADHFGSLIRPMLEDPKWMAGHLEEKVGEDMFQRNTHMKVLDVLGQAEALATKYHVVVANPPYMGGKGMNSRLKNWLKATYPDSKSDLMTCFMERSSYLSKPKGIWGMINLPSWMFLSSYEKLRNKLISTQTISTFVHLGRGIFGSDFGTVAFTIINDKPFNGVFGIYRRLFQDHVQVRSSEIIRKLFLNDSYGLYKVQQSSLQKIPGAPIAYWASNNIYLTFERSIPIASITSLHRGISTGNNDVFARLWHEVPMNHLSLTSNTHEEARHSGARWFPYNRGGVFRKWYGLGIDIIDYEKNGFRMIDAAKRGETPGFRHDGSAEYFRPTITWTALTAGKPSFRILDEGYILGHKGSSIKSSDNNRLTLLALFNSNSIDCFLEYLSQTLDINISQISALPLPESLEDLSVATTTTSLINISKNNWDSYEISWGFTDLPLLNQKYRQSTLMKTVQNLLAIWKKMTLEMKHLEEENNRIFIDAYGLQDQLTPEVPLNQITLTSNPHYRYGNNKTDAVLENLLLADTMKEFISYAVGCMFGRYSLDKPGLILANQGDTLEEYLAQVAEPTFTPDDDNVIPILEEGWFTDDITERFYNFLKVTFGEEHFDENLAFLEGAIGKTVRKYFLNDFYTDHVTRYKKRPIYWMFESPKKSFRCLIYMHRYQPDTVSVFLNDYLRDYHSKLSSRKQHLESVEASASASKPEKTKAMKEMDKIRKILLELEAWERDVIFPMAGRQIDIDLDDGVKVNYRKFDGALKKITGL